MAEILQVHQKSQKSHPAVHSNALGANPTNWYFRSNLSDDYTNGRGRSSSASSSPDIVPLGSVPISTSKYKETFLDIFNKDIGANLSINELNFIYLRGKSLSDVDSVSFKLYYSSVNLLLAPALWSSNVLTTADGKDTVTLTNLKANTPVVADPPFLWIPPPNFQNFSYSLIARTTDSPDPSSIHHANIQEFSQWLVENDGYAWRNITNITGKIPEEIVKSTSISIPKDWQPVKAVITLKANNAPVGWDVSFTLTVPDANGNAVHLVRTAITQNNVTYGVPAVFSPGYSSDVYYYIWTNGIPELPGKQFQINVELAIFTDDSTPALFAKSVPVLDVVHSLDYVKGHLQLPPLMNAEEVHAVKRAFKVGGDCIQGATHVLVQTQQ